MVRGRPGRAGLVEQAITAIFQKPAAPLANGADSEEKHEPASDIDIVVVDGLKALDPKRPIEKQTSGPDARRLLRRLTCSGNVLDFRCVPIARWVVSVFKGFCPNLNFEVS